MNRETSPCLLATIDMASEIQGKISYVQSSHRAFEIVAPSTQVNEAAFEGDGEVSSACFPATTLCRVRRTTTLSTHLS
jgi:hypothetical protein